MARRHRSTTNKWIHLHLYRCWQNPTQRWQQGHILITWIQGLEFFTALLQQCSWSSHAHPNLRSVVAMDNRCSVSCMLAYMHRSTISTHLHLWWSWLIVFWHIPTYPQWTTLNFNIEATPFFINQLLFNGLSFGWLRAKLRKPFLFPPGLCTKKASQVNS